MLQRREPQQDRSRATRERLLDATVDSLAEVGWHGTTVVAVAARAGVSRGAAQHHFATRDDIVQAAMLRVGEALVTRLREQAARAASSRDVLVVLTGMWVEPAGRAALQLWIAASTDPALRELVLPLERGLTGELTLLTAEMLHLDLADAQDRQAVRLVLDAARGVGVGILVRGDLSVRQADLARWAEVLAAPGLSDRRR